VKNATEICFRRLIVARTRWVGGVAFCLGVASLSAQPPVSSPPKVLYKTAASVLALTYDVAQRGGFAMIQGTVTLSYGKALVVQDRTGGIWVDSVSGKYAPGDLLTVIGPVAPGRYSPQIVAPRVQLIGKRPLPSPRTVSFRELSSGMEDAQYVAVEGTIRAVRLNPMPVLGGVELTLAMPDGRVEAILSSEYEQFARSLIDAKVQITATALSRKNDNMQETGVVLEIADIRGISVIQPAPPDLFSAPIVPIGSLMRYRSNTDYFHRVRLSGVLTYYEPGSRLMLQDGTDAIEVFLTDSPPLEVGDRIEVVGFPAPEAYGPVLRDAVLRKLAHGTPLTPVPVDWHQALSSKYRFCLVSIDMRLLRIIDEPTRTLLLLEDGDHVTTAELQSRLSTPTPLAPGSAVRISGINLLSGESRFIYQGSAIHSNLLLRTLNDASLIAPAPWWTRTRLFFLAAALGVLTLAFFILLLYVQLKRWKTETVLQERERLARDIHDTLAQSFAGIGFQLRVIQKAIAPVDDPNLSHHVDVARKLVQFSHREARRSLVPVPSDNSQYADLLASLKICAQSLAESGQVEIDASCSGVVRPLSVRVNAELFHLGQEAIANAIRHAEPTRLVIVVAYQGDSMRLTVADNGRGFTMSGDLLGFGIRGMRKRASEIGGDLDITSVPGSGTSVSITVQLPKQNALHALLNTAQTFVRTMLEA